MIALFLIPFFAFACCVFGQFYLMRQVRVLLANKHPDLWRDLSSKFFIDNAIFSFIWKKRDRDLGDPELTAVAGRMRKLQLVAIGIWFISLVGMFTTFGRSNP
jgi:hypothetical protein